MRESLDASNTAPAIDFDVEDALEIPAFVPDTSATAEVELDDSYNPSPRAQAELGECRKCRPSPMTRSPILFALRRHTS